MLVKASIAATALIVATLTLHSVDFRELYNEMYPVNGLKRDVLGLCHQAKPTFVRAVRADRNSCYDSMPDSVELAIGWIRSTTRLATMRLTQTPVERAEQLLTEVAAQRRLNLPGAAEFTGYAPLPAAAIPCNTAIGQPVREADGRQRIGGNADPTMVALGLAPKDAREVQRHGFAHGHQAATPVPNHAGGLELAPAAATGCKTPI
ncbi:MAG TPA: hypothetical protein VHY35_10925 [Stellaceae bacterium]|jgi:hypothetical protein|nr:hypothetical protein [Stellaceae bacterium]